MNIEIMSEVKKTTTHFQLKLLDINESRIEVPDVEVSDTSCAVAMLWPPVVPSDPRVMDVHVLPPSALNSAVTSVPSVVVPAPFV